MNINSYYSLKLTKDDIAKNIHREMVGGLWDEIGKLTFEFLRYHAKLKPGMKLLDLGCGCFRCGIPIIEFLNSDNYYGIDVNEDLVSAGFTELRKYNLEKKLSSKNIHITDDFNAEIFNVKFDIIIAQSLWTHLPLNQIQRSLANMDKVLSFAGAFYTTFFLCPKKHELLEPYRHSAGGVISFRDRDPYHYRLEDFSYLIKQLELKLKFEFIGNWNHPRNQYMICFKKT